jgi:hypothetical protein
MLTVDSDRTIPQAKQSVKHGVFGRIGKSVFWYPTEQDWWSQFRVPHAPKNNSATDSEALSRQWRRWLLKSCLSLNIAPKLLLVVKHHELVQSEALLKVVKGGRPRYYRFNVTTGMSGIGLQEANKMDKISQVTDAYLSEPERRELISDCVELLHCDETIRVAAG